MTGLGLIGTSHFEFSLGIWLSGYLCCVIEFLGLELWVPYHLLIKSGLLHCQQSRQPGQAKYQHGLISEAQY